MRKIFAALMMICSPAFGLGLPESVGEWHSVSGNTMPLITEYNHESHGAVTYRIYKRESPSAEIEVILTEGSGAGSLYIPAEVNASEGMMTAEGGFELVKLSGHDGIIESVPFMPLVISVSAGENITVNLESRSAKRDELMRFAEEILRCMSAD